jgi:hypothetical protein
MCTGDRVVVNGYIIRFCKVKYISLGSHPVVVRFALQALTDLAQRNFDAL